MVDPLAEYRGKRDPARTTEPFPGARPPDTTPGGAQAGGTFVVQEHHARRLHWDFRLERDGVLVSWAVPKGVPDDPAVNHLAVHTEDHPLEYGSFRGEVPRGEYGAGQVTIWDHGTYEVVKWTDREVKVVLHGERVSGGYVLFATGGKNWMIHRERLSLPVAVKPMLASPGGPPARDLAAWSAEMKWDGVRALSFIESGRLRLTSRTGKDITATYPEVAGLGHAVGHKQALLDGEIVAFVDGRPSFEALQPRMHVSSPAQAQRLAQQTPVTYLVFDVLQLDGRSLAGLPVRRAPGDPPGPGAGRRRLALPARVPRRGPGRRAVRLPGQRAGGRGDQAARLCLRARDPVGQLGEDQERPRAGGRGGRLTSRAGATGPAWSARCWWACTARTPDGNRGLLYCGHVGTGFDTGTLRMLSRRLEGLRRPDSPFDGPVPAEYARPALWVEPRLVIEVVFHRWTRAGRMIAPAYQGLRDDKDPADVVRET